MVMMIEEMMIEERMYNNKGKDEHKYDGQMSKSKFRVWYPISSSKLIEEVRSVRYLIILFPVHNLSADICLLIFNLDAYA